MVTRIGRDLYFGTEDYDQDQGEYYDFVNGEFTQTRNHMVNTGGHSDGTYCPVCPGLIISLKDVPTYAETFPERIDNVVFDLEKARIVGVLDWELATVGDPLMDLGSSLA